MFDEADGSELSGWLRFIGSRVAEGAALAAWCLVMWALHEYVVKRFPLGGRAGLMVRLSECIFDASAIAQLLRLLFLRRKRAGNVPWWK